MKRADMKIWTEIFDLYLEDSNRKIHCPNCKESLLKFIREEQFIKIGKRVFLTAFCERCSESQNVKKIILHT